MTMLPPDHPDRLAQRRGTRAPPEALDTPSRVSYVAVLIEREQREQRERGLEHLSRLCVGFGAPSPPPESSHFAWDLGPLRLKWERHSEFSGYTFVTAGTSPEPFREPPILKLPPGWLAGIPGQTVFAAHATVLSAADGEPDAVFLAAQFDGHVVVGAEIGGGAGFAYTDFLVRDEGFGRLLILDRGFTPRQAGRMLQRLLEIDTYRMMALLAFPLVRPLSSQIAAEVQGTVTRTQSRFSACRAYNELVKTRISELRERRLAGIQPIEEFMSRRFSPAVARCASTAQRLLELSDRVGQASALLSTRVDIAREQQNHSLLE